MSEDEIDEDEVKPVKAGPHLQAIKNLMATEGLDYATAYDRIMNPKTVKTFDWYADQPTPTPQPKRQFSIENLETLASEIDTSLETIENEKADLQQQNEEIEAKKQQLKGIAYRLLEQERSLEERLKQQTQNEENLKKFVEDYNLKVEAFNEGMQKLKEMAEQENQKVHGYIKKISVSNEKEFKS